MINILLAIITIDIVILVHEFGHYYFCKINKCAVLEFSVGLGPKIISFRIDETLFCLRIFPILGYVRVYGEDGVSDISKDKETLAIIKKNNLYNLEDLKLFQKISVLLGGVFFNVILAIFFSYLIVILSGNPRTDILITGTLPDSPAQIADLRAGDRVVAVQNKNIDSSKFFLEAIHDPRNKTLVLLIVRDKQKKEIIIPPIYSTKEKRRIIGATFMESLSFSKEHFKLSDYLFGGLSLVWQQTKDTFNILTSLITRRVSPSQLIGPAGIIGITSNIIGVGNLFILFYFLSLININLAVVNALPIPLLDGYACIITGIESLIRRKIDLKITMALQYIGIAFFIFVFLFITFNDINRFFLPFHK